MSYLHRYIPPIYVDLNMPTTPFKHREPSPAVCSPTKFATAVQSSRDNVEPRPCRTNSLFLDLLDFPLTANDHNSDGLKCDLNSMLDMNTEHDTPSDAHHPIFPFPNMDGDQDDITIKQTKDPETLKDVETFPAAVFINTTISASRSAATTSAVSNNNRRTSFLVNQRGGRASQFSAKQRRERHNANERRRTNAAKDRIRDMRDMVMTLGRQHVELIVQRDTKAAANETLLHRRPIETVLPREDIEKHNIPGSSAYLDLIKFADELREEKRFLEERLDQLDSQNSALQAVQTGLLIDSTASLPATKKTLKRKRVEDGENINKALNSKRMTLESCGTDIPIGGYCIETEAVPSYLKVLFSKPMASDVAFDWVKDSYGDIMALKSQQKSAKSAEATVLGWHEDKREVTKSNDDDEHSLEVMLTQDFPGITSSELVFKTWNLLTTLEAFRKLFPLTKDLAILQTINDDCVVVRVGIAPFRDAPVVHSIVILARGQIDGGYLVSVRSVPLSAGQKVFAAYEESYLPVLAWLMILEKYDEVAEPVCEVIAGASTQHKSEEVLHQLATEFVTGLVRWQDAVSQTTHWNF